MGSGRVRFDGAVVATGGAVLGVAYLLGAMLALLADGGGAGLLLGGSTPITAGAGVALTVAAGLLATGHRRGRVVGMVAFGAVALFGRPSLASPDPVLVVQSAVAASFVLYLLVRNPVPTSDRSNVDESTSATRVGSTLR